jgi:hypothetical protein
MATLDLLIAVEGGEGDGLIVRTSGVAEVAKR